MPEARQTDELHIFLVAGEESGDRLGAALIQSLRQCEGGRVRFSGVGGTQMAAQGVPSLFPLGDLAIVGVLAVIARLPQILRRIRETADAVIAAKPDVLVIIDSPEFTHRVARRVRARAPHIPIVDYVCPTVWAWRPGRAAAMRGYIDHVLALLPFEPAAVARLGGPPCSYVGHPLIEQLNELRPNAEEARRRLSEPAVLLVMPGSRTAEVRRFAALFGAAVGLIAEQFSTLEVVVPTLPRLAETVRAAVAAWPVRARVVVDPADKYAVYRVARAALVKSGTSTLELALSGVPMVAAYKFPALDAMVLRPLLKVDEFILANLVLGERAVPSLLQDACTPPRLAAALLPLLSDTAKRSAQLAAFARLDAVMKIGSARPSERAAAGVLGCVKRSTQL